MATKVATLVLIWLTPRQHTIVKIGSRRHMMQPFSCDASAGRGAGGAMRVCHAWPRLMGWRVCCTFSHRRRYRTSYRREECTRGTRAAARPPSRGRGLCLRSSRPPRWSRGSRAAARPLSPTQIAKRLAKLVHIRSHYKCDKRGSTWRGGGETAVLVLVVALIYGVLFASMFAAS